MSAAPPPGRIRRAEHKARRRQALLEGAIEVLHTHGLEGFTTGRIAKRAGISQSGFYKYWPDRDAALRDVALHVGEQILGTIRAARLAAGADPAGLPRSFAGALRSMLDQRRTTELFLRFRHAPGPMGEVSRELLNRALAELEEDLVTLGLAEPGEPARRLAIYTAMVVIGLVEALMEGRLDDVDAVSDDLGRMAGRILGAR